MTLESDCQSVSEMSRCFWLLVTLLLIHSINGLSNDDLADFIPTDVDCKVDTNTPSDEQNVAVELSWNIGDDAQNDIRVFNISCHCTISGFQIHFDKFLLSPTCCSSRIPFNGASCYDKCHCSVLSVTYFLNSVMNWSDVSTCHIGPKAPRASPVIISSPKRRHHGKSVEIVFELPSENLYCDSTAVINSITVNVTEPVNGSYQLIYDQLQPGELRTDERSYKFTFQVEHNQFWRPFNITISVNNSIGSSPFTDHMIVRGPINGDITRTDYELQLYYDENVNSDYSLLHFYWNLSKKAEYMMDSQFITGFKICIERELENSTICATSLARNLTLNITLKPNHDQWHLIIGRVLTKDNDTWGPEPIYKFFESPGSTVSVSVDLPEHSSQSSASDNCLLVIILSIIILLIILVATVFLNITRIIGAPTKLVKLCHNDDGDGDDSCIDKMNEAIGTIPDSCPECDPSTVENISNGGYLYKIQVDNKTDDLDSMYNTCMFKSTPV